MVVAGGVKTHTCLCLRVHVNVGVSECVWALCLFMHAYILSYLCDLLFPVNTHLVEQAALWIR